MRPREQVIMREALTDLQEMPAWKALLDLAVDSTVGDKKQLLVSASTTQESRLVIIGRMQGIYAYFQKIAKETGKELPPHFIEHFTGERPE